MKARFTVNTDTIWQAFWSQADIDQTLICLLTNRAVGYSW